MLLPELNLPVPFEQANHDYPEELSDAEEEERPLIIDLQPNLDPPIASSTSTPITSAITAVTSNETTAPYVPASANATVTTSSMTYNPTPLNQLPGARSTARKIHSDIEVSRSRNRSSGNEHDVRPSSRGVLSAGRTIAQTTERPPKTKSTTATTTVTSVISVENEPRMSETDYYRKKTIKRRMEHSQPRRIHEQRSED